jgi:predicted Zn-dependent protease
MTAGTWGVVLLLLVALVPGCSQFTGAGTLSLQRPGTVLRQAELYLAEGRATKAIEAFDLAASLAPLPPASRVLLAKAYHAAKRPDLAEHALRECAAFGSLLAPRQALAEFYEITDRPQEAIGEYRRLLTVAKGRARTRAACRLALLQQRTGNAAEAERTLRDSLRRDPGNVDAAIMAAGQLVRSGRVDAGIECLQQAAKSAPGSPEVLAALATAYRAAGRPGDAERAYLRALRTDPHHLAASNDLAYLRATQGRATIGAERLALAAVKAAPGNSKCLDTLGFVQLRRGHVDKAIDTLEGALHRAPGDPLICYHLGRAYLQFGARGLALSYLSAAMDSKKPFDESKDCQRLLDRLTKKSQG